MRQWAKLLKENDMAHQPLVELANTLRNISIQIRKVAKDKSLSEEEASRTIADILNNELEKYIDLEGHRENVNAMFDRVADTYTKLDKMLYKDPPKNKKIIKLDEFLD